MPFNARRFGAMLRAQNLDQFIEKVNAWEERVAASDRFRAELGGSSTLELNILDVIGWDPWEGGGITSKTVKQALDQYPDVENIRCVIDSPGGSAFDGIAIRSLLNRHPAHVTIEVVGLAASAASIIAMSGDVIEVHAGSMMMIHRAASCMCGHAEDLIKEAEVLKGLDQSLIDIYVDRVNGDPKTIAKMVRDETWFTANEAVEAGFADKVIKKKVQPAAIVPPAEDKADPAMRQTRVARVSPMNQLRSLGACFGDT